MTDMVSIERVANKIYAIRDTRVMLDRDLAELYGVETKQLKRAVRRNIDRFPPDFMFELTKEEYDSLRYQFGTLKRGQHSKYLPFAFTEQGVAMAGSKAKVKRRPDQLISIENLKDSMNGSSHLTAKQELSSYLLLHKLTPK
jgi:hypothetical protein